MTQDPNSLGLADQQNLFFRNPNEAPVVPGINGTLYLLRRDLNDMTNFLRDPNDGCRPVDVALWPRTMAILAGIDLLAKFFANSDDTRPGAIGERYRRYVAEFITEDRNINSIETRAVWQCRNSVLHSFGWFSQDRTDTFRFRLLRNPGAWVVQQEAPGSETWFVNITRLENRFNFSIIEFENRINDPARQDSFPQGNNIFERYGWMFIG